MWQAPSQRNRTSKRRGGRERNRKPLHIRRVAAELKTLGVPGSSTLVDARVILNDISPDGVGLFAEKPLEAGQLVALALQYPRQMYIRARVSWCDEHAATSHVVSAKPFGFRMGLLFLFETEKEQQLIREYVELLSRDHLHTDSPVAA